MVFQTFADPMKANIIKGLLDSYGIECFLADENMAGLYAPFTPAIGGVKLNVFEKDIARIDSILNAENFDPETLKTENNESEINCPKCHSTNVAPGDSSKKKFGLWTFFIFSFICIFPFFSQPFNKRKAFHCFHCDYDFNKS
jgi:hypothetical protein